MIKGAQNRIKQWCKQFLSVSPNRSSTISTGIPCAVPKVGSVSYHTDIKKNTHQLLPAPASFVSEEQGCTPRLQKLLGFTDWGVDLVVPCSELRIFLHKAQCSAPFTKASDTLRQGQYGVLVFRHTIASLLRPPQMPQVRREPWHL